MAPRPAASAMRRRRRRATAARTARDLASALAAVRLLSFRVPWFKPLLRRPTN